MKKLTFILLALVPIICFGQLSKDEKYKTTHEILELIKSRYVFPAVADSMKYYILDNWQKQKYDTIADGKEFAFQLTRDLQHISNDLHLNIDYKETKPKRSESKEINSEEENVWLNKLMLENNYGIKTKKILDGNIGYLEIPLFGPLNICVDSLKAAMHFVENTDALILDLRSCRGSLDENTIPFFCSYFFEEPVHLFDFYTYETNSTRQFWTHAWIPGKRYTEKPIYILTSGRTFSGGEEIAYDLKHLNRAQIIGENTKGGANPTDYVQINSQFAISVPYMRSINPITKTNWEHIGVAPDIRVKSNIALYTAHVAALKKLYQLVADEKHRNNLHKILKETEGNKPQLKLVEFKLKGFENAKHVFVAGSFNSWAPKNTPLKKQDGLWIGKVECEPGKVSYQFVVDGRWITDPENQKIITENGYERSFLIVK